MEEERDTKLEVETGWPTRERRFNRVSDAPLAPDFFIFDLFCLFVLFEGENDDDDTSAQNTNTDSVNNQDKYNRKRDRKEKPKREREIITIT